ncbi:transposase [Dolichospermum sp. UHCC 0352]|nr:transposase [Dolichospermum sp. UHCC 0299]MTJ23049.1 transposase [Dolichospermum sp. UHCC 0352]MTJ41581.1 transposase [Dolichospermum sp. UHCC 0406]
MLDGIFYQLRTGCNWGDLPKDMPFYLIMYVYRLKDFVFICVPNGRAIL